MPAVAPSWLNGVHPKRTEGAGVQAGTTIDQTRRQRAGQADPPAVTRTGARVAGAQASAAATTATPVSTSTPSRGGRRPRRCRWKSIRASRSIGCSATAARPPRGWRRLAGAGASSTPCSRRPPVCRQTLGSSDRTKVNEYLDSVREVERRIQRAEGQTGELSLQLPDRPTDIPETFAEHMKLMFDLQVLAFQADITRVTSLLIGREQSGRSFPGNRRGRAASLAVASSRRSRLHR